MEMQFMITKGSLPPEITVRIALEMQGQPPAPINERDSITDSQMENVSGNIAKQDQLFEKLARLRKQIDSEAEIPPYTIFHDNTLKIYRWRTNDL